MLKVYKTAVYFILAILSIGVVHSGTATASNINHLENNSYIQSSNECKPICHGAPAVHRSKLVDVKKDERKPTPPSSGINSSIRVGSFDQLLTDRQIWKLASWVPPDRLLISSAYTTSH